MNTRYKNLKSQNGNLFYFFNNQLDYALDYYFADSETIKRNVDKFFTNLLMKLIIKNLLYQNVNEWIEKLSAIL